MGAAPFEAAGPKDDRGDQELNLSSCKAVPVCR